MRAPRVRRGWALAALLIAGAAGAQTPPTAPPLRPSSGGTSAGAAATATTPAGAAGPRNAAAPFTPATPVAPAASVAVTAPTAPLSSLGLSGGGDAAPLCRARCTPAFYGCVSGGAGDGSCHIALGVCRRNCEALSAPVGRLQSPLPAAGLAPVGPLKPLPGGLPAPQ